MIKSFLTNIHNRRSIYNINNVSPLSEKEITEVIEKLVEDVPSAFNSQSPQLAILFGQANQDFWQIVMETLRACVPEDKFAPTETKINGFAAGFGTILYFDDEDITRGLEEAFPAYAANFKSWGEQANGMLQFAIWTALEIEGLGASLQHYNPIIDEKVREKFKLPKNYRLIAQMPFGGVVSAADEKVVRPGAERIKVFK